MRLIYRLLVLVRVRGRGWGLLRPGGQGRRRSAHALVFNPGRPCLRSLFLCRIQGTFACLYIAIIERASTMKLVVAVDDA